MSAYEIRGFNLFDPYRRKIATARDQAIYDANDMLVATVRGNEIYDSNDRMMAVIQGADIYDARMTKVGTALDVMRSVRGATEGGLHMALWYCFVR